MTSQLDQAQKFEERDRQAAIARVRSLPAVPSNWLICADCGDEISPPRKKAMPSTKFCVNCAEERER